MTEQRARAMPCFAKALCETDAVELRSPRRSGGPWEPRVSRPRWKRMSTGSLAEPARCSARSRSPRGRSEAVTKRRPEGTRRGRSSDLIVVGSTHRGRVGSVFPGSVGGASSTERPAPPWSRLAGLADANVSMETIAVGYDGSRASVIALDRAVDLAERIGASLLILGAVEIEIGPPAMRPAAEGSGEGANGAPPAACGGDGALFGPSRVATAVRSPRSGACRCGKRSRPPGARLSRQLHAPSPTWCSVASAQRPVPDAVTS